MDLARQVAHLLRHYGETYPAPLIGGFVVETRADDRINVYWRVPGRLRLPFLRMRSLRRYERILTGLGMATALHADGPEPYLACWLGDERRPDVSSSPAARTSDELPATEPALAEGRREPALSR